MTDWFAFSALCLAWGSTFIALKFGLEGFPPLALAGWRFVIAGTMLWAVTRIRRAPALPAQALKRALRASLMIVVNYSLVFWAALHLPSGLTATISFATVALTLTASSVLLRLEPPRKSTWAGLSLGLIGLGVLTAPRLTGAGLWPVLAAVTGNVAYVIGSLYIRETVRAHGTIRVTAAQALAGGLLLLALSLTLEPQASITLGPRAITGLAYLVIAGSMIGFSLYQHLLVRWPPGRLALYNFVCPVIALALGAIIAQEQLSALEMTATALMLVGAAISGLARLSPAT